jgi:acyl dehydratase
LKCDLNAEKMKEIFFEDLKPGQIFSSGTIRVDSEEIKAFAAQYDPQPFHLDETSAQNTFFRGLAASVPCG